MDQGIKVLDCTIRDGGLLNNHRFEKNFVRKLFEAVSSAGVDYIELGYRNSITQFPPDEYGPFKHCNDNELRDITNGVVSRARVAVMMDVGRCDIKEIKPVHESPIDMIRVATYIEDVAKAVEMSCDLAVKGYEVSLNLMAISRDRGPELDRALERIRIESAAQVVYIVDSFGALRPGATAELVGRFRSGLPGKIIGFHGHNNQQLALANSLEAIRYGATFVDGTVFGMGRAAGNCPLELLLGHMEQGDYDLDPLVDLIEKEVIPLRESMAWGYSLPYALTGLLNRHPRTAGEILRDAPRDKHCRFFDYLRENLDR